MKTFLQNHPFAVEAFLDSSLVLTFAAPKETLQALLPPCLVADSFNDRWAFVAVAMVQTKDLRPKGLPKLLGRDFFLIGYRIFVRYTNNAGKNLRGLFILKSETDKRQMKMLGNIFTNYGYTTVDITTEKKKEQFYRVQSVKANLDIIADISDAAIELPATSPFDDWKTARRFAGPLPFTFSFNEHTKEVTIIEGVRQNWVPRPVKIIQQHIGYLNSPMFKGCQLANAFLIENIPYYWKKGKTEQWKG